ncbi:hypothetical protein H181DRAFT_03901 [Streptomyces sp. WMMB 714]|uniref:P-loop NTPase n=1 Tax=Streptomyces sp. WMMB 714 TaxID=1286822 RepID=UPI0005F8928D|nr:hypothetical protein [Streptomyces sp. WMMB 714]SCK44255.1 hypothetical protein H181DRAFT_03901 [Streptomyces sp. WMMB 714]
MSVKDLDRLEMEWRRRMPQHAAGGRYSVAGFHYQFLSTLLRTVRRFIADKGRTTAPVIAECLSDILSVEDNAVVVIQVKRRLTPKTVRDALRELRAIHELASSFPALQPHLRFEIQAAKSEVADVQGVFDTWCAKAGEDVEDFISRVSVSTVADAGGELFALLHQELKAADPVGRAHQWLASLVEASESDEGFSLAARAIWNDLVTLHAERNFRGDGILLWRDEHVPPSTVSQGDFLTGQQPMLHHLRQGFFAERPKALEKAERDFLDWIDSRPAFADKTVRLPVFWIGGRSGVGKSVLLLQLLSRLHADGVARILWLANNPQSMAGSIEWARQAAETAQESDRVWVIAIDDPYLVGSSAEATAHWREALDRIEDLRQEGEGDRVPLIVCCGPTEQAARLEDDFPDDVALTQSIVDNESRADYEQLRSWFTQRTGDTPPPVDEGNLLLVQLFFEWFHGQSLSSFALRFRERLNVMDPSGRIVDAVTRLLTLNRLYTGYPVSAFEELLNPAQRDALETLQKEEHLESRGIGARQDIWVAHPHLSNIIYETWFPAHSSRRQRIDHLRQVIADCDEYGVDTSSRMSPLWALSRVVKDRTGELSARVDSGDLSELLEKTYARIADGDVPMRLSDLPVWIEFSSLRPDRTWSPHPVETAIEFLDDAPTTATGLRLTCHKLLQHASMRAGVGDAVIRLLETATHWREWVPVALDALSRLEDPRLDTIVESWVESWTESRQGDMATPANAVGELLERALQRPTASGRLATVAGSLLPRAPCSLHWGDVAIELHRRHPDAHLPQVMSWLRTYAKRSEAVYLLNELLTSGNGGGVRDEVVRLAVQWSASYHRRPPANFVLEPLLKMLPSNVEVARWAKSWLKVGMGDQGHVIQLLVRQHGEIALGVEWLRTTSMSHPSWTFVFTDAFDADAGDRDLVLQGLIWLEEQFDHSGWPIVWEPLWEAGHHAHWLTSLALSWLAEHPEHGSWSHVWEYLWRAGKHRRELTVQGLAWLEPRIDDPGWTFVWKPLWETGTGGDQQVAIDTDLLAVLALQWISGHLDGYYRRQIWDALWNQNPSTQKAVLNWVKKVPEQAVREHFCSLIFLCGGSSREIRAMGVEPLALVESGRAGWASGWMRLWREGYDREKMRTVGLSCLRDVPDSAGLSRYLKWAEVWRALWVGSHTPQVRGELSDLALRWLTAAPLMKQWKDVFHELRTEGAKDDQLHELAMRRLAGLEPDDSHWGYLWSSAWRHGSDRGELRRSAVDWLRAMPQADSWKHVWFKLWEDGDGLEELWDLGMWYLRTEVTRRGWEYVWYPLWETGERREELGDVAEVWLSVTPRHRSSWGRVHAMQRNSLGSRRDLES